MNHLSALVLGFALLMGGCAQTARQPMISTPPRTLSATAPLRGVVLFVAGLNNRPEVLDDIAHALAARGYEALIVTLYGHAESSWPRADFFAQWQRDIDAAKRLADLTYPTVPKFAVGFSLGGTLLLDSLTRSSDHQYAALALIAPAVTLTSKTSALRPLLLFSGTGLSVPSFAPEKTRAHPGTSLRAYRGLFNAANAVRSSDAKSISVPTLVLAHREDELVAFEDLSEWFRDAPTCRVVEMKTLAPPPSGYFHQLFERENIGEAAWADLINALIAEFEPLSRS